MKRILLISAAVLSVALLIGTDTAAASSSDVKAVEVKGPAFPVRTYVLTLSRGRKLTIHDVSVTENGNPVVEATLVPASQASPEARASATPLEVDRGAGVCLGAPGWRAHRPADIEPTPDARARAGGLARQRERGCRNPIADRGGELGEDRDDRER